jgi:hypothetical protein
MVHVCFLQDTLQAVEHAVTSVTKMEAREMRTLGLLGA